MADAKGVADRYEELLAARDVEIARLRESREELHSFFCSEELAMGFEGDTEGWTAEHSAIVLIRRLRALAGGREAEVARLREALEPFAKAIQAIDPNIRDGIDAMRFGQAKAVTIGDLRRAAEALAPTPPESGRKQPKFCGPHGAYTEDTCPVCAEFAQRHSHRGG